MAEFTYVRETHIDADPARVHALINDFHNWTQWSPWEDVDPDLRRKYSGAESGVGARYAWEGNRKAGKGDMEIVGSTPERIDVRLTFEKPWKATNAVAFTLVPAGDGATEVTWRMNGTQRGFAALFGKFISMDRMVGKDFETGLANLKTIAEREALARS
jgi:hypothetical protein